MTYSLLTFLESFLLIHTFIFAVFNITFPSFDSEVGKKIKNAKNRKVNIKSTWKMRNIRFRENNYF